jgi:hypothetical protein
MTGPVYGLCTAGAGHPLCEGLGDLVGRLSMSLPSGLLVACLAGNPWLGLFFAFFMYLGNVTDPLQDCWGPQQRKSWGPRNILTQNLHTDYR